MSFFGDPELLHLREEGFGQNKFLGIGIGKYEQLPHLSEPCDDVMKIASSLERYGFCKENQSHLFNEYATRENIIYEIRNLCKEAKKQDVLVIFFAGHGFFDAAFQERGYWIPYDAGGVKNSVAIGSYVSNREVVDLIGPSAAKHILLIVDSCFSGSMFIENHHRSGLLLQEEHPSRYAISSGLIEPVGDDSFFISSLTNILDRNEFPTISAPVLCSRIKNEMEERGATETPRGGDLVIPNNVAIGEFLFRLGHDLVQSNFKKKRFKWKSVAILYKLILLCSCFVFAGLVLLPWQAPYLNLVIVSFMVCILFTMGLISGGGWRILRYGKGLSGSYLSQYQKGKNRTFLVIGIVLQTTFLMICLYAFTCFRTISFEVSSDLVWKYKEWNMENGNIQIIKDSYEKPIATFHVGTKLDIRMPIGNHLLGFKYKEYDKVISGELIHLPWGLSPVTIIIK